MSWKDTWGGSKTELAKHVERYADRIGRPYPEILLTLLHAAISDVSLMEDRNAFLMGMLTSPGDTVKAELARRGMSQAELSRITGLYKNTIMNFVNHNADCRLSTVGAIVEALDRGERS
jgi:hypothetical protein